MPRAGKRPRQFPITLAAGSVRSQAGSAACGAAWLPLPHAASTKMALFIDATLYRTSCYIPPQMRTRLERTYRFEAAHFLPKVPAGHKCARMHGHSYSIEVGVEGGGAAEGG